MLLEHKDWQDLKAVQVPKVQLAQQVKQVQLELVMFRVLPEPPDLQEQLVFQVHLPQWDQLVLLDHKVLLGHKVLLVLPVQVLQVQVVT